MPKNGEFGWLCDPAKNTECDHQHCYWTRGGECMITTKWEYATDGDQKKYPKEDE